MPTLTRLQRADTHKSNFAGRIRNIGGKPITVFNDFTDLSEHAIGSIAYDEGNELLYINTTGTPYGWKSMALT